MPKYSLTKTLEYSETTTVVNTTIVGYNGSLKLEENYNTRHTCDYLLSILLHYQNGRNG